MEEIWKAIEGTMGTYEVSNLGRVKKNGKFCKIGEKSNGYKQVSIGFIYGRHVVSLHRLVTAYFADIPNDYENLQINHKDGDKSNNWIGNLEWCTPSDNQQHRANVLGKHIRGDKNPMFGVRGEDSPVFKGYIKMIDPKNGKTVGIYAGSGEAAKAVGGTPSNVIRVINKPRTYHGYKWVREQQ